MEHTFWNAVGAHLTEKLAEKCGNRKQGYPVSMIGLVNSKTEVAQKFPTIFIKTTKKVLQIIKFFKSLSSSNRCRFIRGVMITLYKCVKKLVNCGKTDNS